VEALAARPSRRPAAAVGRAERLLPWLAAALVLASVLRLPAAWESGNALNHVSGAWMTLADDLARGTFYRALHDPSGVYGGTRFFPLSIALHAGLLRAGAGIVAAGYVLSAAAAGLLLAGTLLLLRRLGLSRGPALAFAALAFAGFGAQHGISSVRGDLLPVALSALALAAVVPAATGRRIALAVVLLGLAFAAKPTALTAAGAAVAWLLARRELRAATALAAGVAALAVAVVVATDALSGGRFLAILAACADGGTDLGFAVRAPIRLGDYLATGDPSGVVLIAAAAVPLALAAPSLARAARGPRADAPPLLLAALWLASASAGVLTVFASPGTGTNHLAELEVAAAVTLGALAAGTGRAARAARLAAPVVAAAGLALALETWREDAGSSRLAEVRAAARALPEGPILSEDPLVPLLAGRQPILLDPWMLRLAASRDPALTEALAADLARGAYAAVVLFRDLDAPDADAWYADRNLGLPLVSAIRRGYRRTGEVGTYHLYAPRRPPGAAPDDRRASAARRASAGVVPDPPPR
jgi:hypothetical protein